MSHVLTLIAPRDLGLPAGVVQAVRDAVGGGAVTTLSDNEAVDVALLAPPDLPTVRRALGGAAVDAVCQPAEGRRKLLLVADMDSTIITTETLDELAAYAGKQAAVKDISDRSMNGELDFATALRERVAMLAGLGLDALERTWERVRLTGGARELVATMRAHGALTALVSGGFTFFSGRVAALAGFDIHRANVLIDDGTALTGTVAEPILDRNAKLITLDALAAERGLARSATMAVGDGANDLDMLAAAGLGVAFHARPIVAAAAAARIDHADLRALLFLQGYPAAAFVTA
jgi:phosphoserine phosphatase